MSSKLPLSFYRRDDVTLIARELLGKVLCTNFEGKLTSGIIVETEAYSQSEKACHAFGGKRTPRTEVFYNDGGLSYVYLCYGIHYLFNIITNLAHTADAVLIRAIEPVDGIETMLERRGMTKMEHRIGAGPGSVSKALGLTRHHNAIDLTEDHIWVEKRGINYKEDQIIASPRVGVDYAGDDAFLPWRYRVADSPWVSKAK
ncbi:MAG: 3-methyladenine glycosylase [Bacteroidetes bacterium]|nr:3-methyladenine glycosylase [Bacteroidota bacterium]